MAWHYCSINRRLIIEQYFSKKWKESVCTDKYINFMKQVFEHQFMYYCSTKSC